MRGKTHRDLKGSMKKLNTFMFCFVVLIIAHIQCLVNKKMINFMANMINLLVTTMFKRIFCSFSTIVRSNLA